MRLRQRQNLNNKTRYSSKSSWIRQPRSGPTLSKSQNRQVNSFRSRLSQSERSGTVSSLTEVKVVHRFTSTVNPSPESAPYTAGNSLATRIWSSRKSWPRTTTQYRVRRGTRRQRDQPPGLSSTIWSSSKLSCLARQASLSTSSNQSHSPRRSQVRKLQRICATQSMECLQQEPQPPIV